MVRKYSNENLMAIIKRPDDERAGLDIEDMTWHWLKVTGYDGDTHRAESVIVVDSCKERESNALEKLVQSGEIGQISLFSESGTFLLAVLF